MKMDGMAEERIFEWRDRLMVRLGDKMIVEW